VGKALWAEVRTALVVPDKNIRTSVRKVAGATDTYERVADLRVEDLHLRRKGIVLETVVI